MAATDFQEKPSVLIADDNAALARVVQMVLTQSGMRAEVARDGRQAYAAAMKHPYDLVITDQQMPEMTGVELCRELRKSKRYSETPLILLTAKGIELELSKLKDEFGLTACFPKPFSPAELVAVVQETLREATAT
ncbi:Transcriptional regulatory protein SrrA [Pseudobythopirellula maris]|uniref:Transcriptional regulatory protein SrrA n=1 Tax=Pseudobythopirellula maris TaxID=2527991 RepID=A0A5C5ZQ25_9BACT|nr:response regulator [Pseudobythopirellula maris]TWT88911.1 Transcriptional regulatory protein SrrA [Pseudobythopirellula maris]